MMRRAILLQTNATDSKNAFLRDFLLKSTQCANWVLSKRTGSSLKTLWAEVGPEAKLSWGFSAQVICDIVRSVSKSKGTRVRGIAVKFNIPRNCKTFQTKKHFFIELGLYPKRRIPVPIRKNRNLDRFFGLRGNGWTCKTFALTSNLEIAALMYKEESRSPFRRNMLGIDINAKRIAVSVVSQEGRILLQTYFGKNIWARRKQIMKRRALLQSLGLEKRLEDLRAKESDFVRTNVGQVVKEMVKIANRFKADIAIERLRKFSPKGRRFNREVMRIPFMIIRRILEARCFDNGITLNAVNPWHTSKWCIRCGAAGAGHSAIYSMFRCMRCGLTMNADRKASVAIAVKCLLERNSSPPGETFQISRRRVPVMALIRSSDETTTA